MVTAHRKRTPSCLLGSRRITQKRFGGVAALDHRLMADKPLACRANCPLTFRIVKTMLLVSSIHTNARGHSIAGVRYVRHEGSTNAN